MGLANVIADVEATLKAYAAWAALATATGAEHVFAQGAPPRLVWVPTEDTFTAPQTAGANPRQRLTRHAGVEVHLWGTDLAQAEQLLNDFLASVYKTKYANCEARGGQWHGKDGALIKDGLVVVVSLACQIPIVAPTQTTQTVTQVQVTTKHVDPADGGEESATG